MSNEDSKSESLSKETSFRVKNYKEAMHTRVVVYRGQSGPRT